MKIALLILALVFCISESVLGQNISHLLTVRKLYENLDTVKKVLNNGYLNIDFTNDDWSFEVPTYEDTESQNKGWPIAISNPIKSGINNAPKNLQVIIDTALKVNWRGYRGLRILVVNASKDTARFDTQDSRLYMTTQALDEKGKWRDIEHLPNSDCGNSY